ncbi:MAG: TNF receptor-associated factor 6 [Harvfovirus sp.]|uniref:TNF receptor-associated factor 6 n=1 Tax=Harvfovirus sp. TaxID=2487768 RepID=A0A3G5A588_9VIRU|nr:MAG: TNF receptor-associated factor 6 [Harvfovirus sp.]
MGLQQSTTKQFIIASKLPKTIDPQALVDKYDEFRDLCPICFSIPLEPVSLECGHLFCQECLQTALSKKEKCPICQQISKITDITPDHTTRLRISGLRLKCPNKECKHISTIGKYGATILKHIQNCSQTLVTCIECKTEMKQSETKNHLTADGQCPDRPTVCEICDKYIPYSQLPSHMYSKSHVDTLTEKYKSLQDKLASRTYSEIETFRNLMKYPELYLKFNYALSDINSKRRRIITEELD